jgi:zinc transport system substrate-binding protein
MRIPGQFEPADAQRYKIAFVMKPAFRHLLVFASLLLAAPAVAAVRLAVSVPPLAEFAQRVGGDRVSVQTLVGPGQNPHSFEPTARQVEELTSAQLFWRVGMPFEEAWIGRLRSQNRTLNVLDARAGLDLPGSGGRVAAHGDHRPHDHDPHVWTSPVLVLTMVRGLADALSIIDPESATAYRANAAAFGAELQALDAELRQILAPVKHRRFLVYHPAWGEFAATYGLEQIAIERDAKEPGARSLAELASQARRDGVQVIFVQPQSSVRSAQTLAREIGARIVVIDSLARDYGGTLRTLARAIAEASP